MGNLGQHFIGREPPQAVKVFHRLTAAGSFGIFRSLAALPRQRHRRRRAVNIRQTQRARLPLLAGQKRANAEPDHHRHKDEHRPPKDSTMGGKLTPAAARRIRLRALGCLRRLGISQSLLTGIFLIQTVLGGNNLHRACLILLRSATASIHRFGTFGRLFRLGLRSFGKSTIALRHRLPRLVFELLLPGLVLVPGHIRLLRRAPILQRHPRHRPGV